MDDSTNLLELKQRIREFCEERDWDQFHNPKDLAIGIITESSELLEHFRFRSEKEIEEMLLSPDKKQEISEEIADILYFVIRFAQRYDIDLSTELDKKMKKNAERYPVEKAKGSNRKYNQL
jgi:NTP pyrophosphatase (non-canonical NTP hydrolase)